MFTCHKSKSIYCICPTTCTTAVNIFIIFTSEYNGGHGEKKRRTLSERAVNKLNEYMNANLQPHYRCKWITINSI